MATKTEIPAGTATTKAAVTLSKEEVMRYSRHLIMPEVGMEGQLKIKQAKVLCIGTGGLGAPLGLYLAAAGVGRIGLVDFDVVDTTNLQRQVLFGTSDVGRPKTEAAAERLRNLNPDIQIDTFETQLTSANALELFKDYDIIIDGTDNFPTRYCVNDACVIAGKPNVYGSIFRFEGMGTVFAPPPENPLRPGERGPRYRCMYPEPPDPGSVPSCAEGGVIGVLPGIIGTLQANEVIKLILGIGTPAIGKLLTFSSMDLDFKSFKLRRDPACPVCGDHPTIKEPIDYEQFCGVPALDPKSLAETAAEAHQSKGGPVPVSNLDPKGLPPGYPFDPAWEVTPREVKSLLDKNEKFVFIDCRL